MRWGSAVLLLLGLLLVPCVACDDDARQGFDLLACDATCQAGVCQVVPSGVRCPQCITDGDCVDGWCGYDHAVGGVCLPDDYSEEAWLALQEEVSR